MDDMEHLRLQAKIIQQQIEALLEKHQTQPVGDGYIDIITPSEHLAKLVEDLTRVGITINGVSWWCHCSEQNKKQFGCPHGLGGPKLFILTAGLAKWESIMRVLRFQIMSTEK